MGKRCGFSLAPLEMFSWLVCIIYFAGAQYNTFTLADSTKVWISSPNISPLQKIFYPNQFIRSSTCPSPVSSLCSETSKIKNANSLYEGVALNENLSDVLLNPIFEEEKTLPNGNDYNNDLKNVVLLEPVVSVKNGKAAELPAPDPTPIATFDEWTKEKLKLEELKKNSHVKHRSTESGTGLGKGLQDGGSRLLPNEEATKGFSQEVPVSMVLPQEPAHRNYASKECGAKVLFSNEEAENRAGFFTIRQSTLSVIDICSNVLKTSRSYLTRQSFEKARNAVLNEKEADDYMRNPCERAQHKWIIFELCETVQPRTLEIANFELFSSSPRDVRISGSERYPSGDWIMLGEFQVEDTRSVQRFPITANGVYVKFIRLELLTHYGREHYCTLSLVRLFGVSMVDEYEAEAEAAAVPIPETVENTVALPVSLDSSQLGSKEVIKKNLSLTAAEIVGSDDAQQKKQQPSDPNEHSTSKLKDRHIVDAVVGVMGNIGIKNIKNVIESAFLRKWKKKSTCLECSNFSVAWLCKTCYPSGFHPISYLFCRAFFRVSRTVQKRSKFVNVELVINSDMPESLLGPPIRLSKVTKAQKDFLHRISSKFCSLRKRQVTNVGNLTSLSNLTVAENITFASKPVNAVPLLIPSDKLVVQTLPGGTMSHKESVFLKLNKRINALELNMSLSSEYLSELSRRYVEYMNESQKQTEKTLKMAETAAANAVHVVKVDLKAQIDKLSLELKEVERLMKVLTGGSLSSQSALKKKAVIHVEKNSPNTYGIPPCQLEEDERTLSAPQPHILYSNDHLWTTEQLIYMVVLAQGCTVLLMFLAQCCYNRRHFIEVRNFQKVVDEKIAKAIAERTHPIADDNSATILPGAKKKRNKHKKQCSRHDLARPSSTGSSSLLSITHPLTEELSKMEVDSSVRNVDSHVFELKRKNWRRQPAEEIWNGLECGYSKRSSKDMIRSASTGELSVFSSDFSSEQMYGLSLDEVQHTLSKEKRNQNEPKYANSLMNSDWQIVMKRRRKKLNKSPFKQVL